MIRLEHNQTVQKYFFRMFSLAKSLLKTAQTPSYTAEKDPKNTDFEVRRYPAAKWMSTTVKAMSHKEAGSTGFRRLFNYIQGENESKSTVDMTAPVTVKVEPGDGPTCENTFTVSFYIPTEHQDNPPKPTNKDIFVEERPAMTVYARTFGGFAGDEDWIQQSKLLMSAIGDEKKYESRFFYTAGYNSPFKLTGRTNDVWLIKTD